MGPGWSRFLKRTPPTRTSGSSVRVGNPASLGMSQRSTADLVEQPLTPDAPVTAQVGIPLHARPTLRSSIFPVVKQGFSGAPSFGILSTYPPTGCGVAMFSSALPDALTANGAELSVVRVADGPPS
jgi:hypothetical protein